jgi:N-acetylglutamate synthase-like GNAT family acetyltransferase
VPVQPRKIRRVRPSDQVSVEQTHDVTAVAMMFAQAGTTMRLDLTDSSACFLMSYLGDEPVGIAELETEVDAALVRSLFVTETMRRRGVGTALIEGARLAARARGARTLYAVAPPTAVGYFARFGFSEVDRARMSKAFSSLSTHAEAPPNEESECRAIRLDISRDGLIER